MFTKRVLFDFLQTCYMKVDHVIGRFIIPVIILYCISCNKSNDVSSSQTNSSAVTIADILSCQIVGMHPQICIISPYVNIMFADSVTNPGDLVASFSLSSGAHANLNGIAQVSGKFIRPIVNLPSLYKKSKLNFIN